MFNLRLRDQNIIVPVYRKLLHHKSKIQAKKCNSQIIGVPKFMLECYPSEAAPPGEHVLPNHLI